MRVTILIAVSTVVAGCAGTSETPTAAPVASSVSAQPSALTLSSVARTSPFAFQRGEGGFASERPGYRVQVADGGAWTIKPRQTQRGGTKSGEKAPEGAALRLETVAIQRGGAATVQGGTVKAGEVNEVSIDRGLAVESLKNTKDGVEQSWTFRDAPPVDASATAGVADLVVRVSVSGHDFLSAGSKGIDFRDPASKLGIRYGEATWVDAGGDRTTILPTYADGQIVMTIPHEVVARTRFPAVLDPSVGPVLAVSGQSDSPGVGPQVAYGNGVYAVVWQDGLAGAQSAHVQLVTAAGALTGGNIAVAVNANTEPFITIGFDGTNFQLIWIDGASANLINGQRLSTTGSWVDLSPVTIDNTPEQKNNLRIASNANGQSLAVFGFVSNISSVFATKAIRVKNGAAVGADIIVQNGVGNGLEEDNPSVASDGSNYLVGYIDAQTGNPGITVRTVSELGAVGPPVFAESAYVAESPPNITYGGGLFLIAWTDSRLGTMVTVWGNTFNYPTSTFTGGANGFAIAQPFASLQPAVAWDGGHYVVPFFSGTSGGVGVQQVNTAGTLFGGSYTAGFAQFTQSPVVASAGVGKSLIAFFNSNAGHMQAQLFSSGMNGAPCTANADCDSTICVANAPGVPGSSCCGTTCTASDSCHVAQCSTGTCTNVARSACGTISTCEVSVDGGCNTPAPDTDGDNLADVWENSTGGPNNSAFADYNCDGVYEAGETPLPGASASKPDIYVYYDYMGWGIEGNQCSTSADCLALGYAHGADPKAVQGAILPTPSCIHNQCAYTCNSTADCTRATRPGNHSTEQCSNANVSYPNGYFDINANAFGNVCLHTHDPEVLAPNALAAVTTAFNNRGYNLHITRALNPQPHSLVTSYRTDSVMTTTCEGGSASAHSVGPGQFAVSVYDLKNSGGSPFPQAAHIFHYGLFAHYSACDTAAHCGACPSSQNPNGTVKNSPIAGESGLAEISGNDFVVSLGQAFSDNGSSPGVYNVATTFMHELGHNLGLHHAGGIDIPCTSNANCPNGVTCNPSPTLPGYSFCFQSESPEQNYKPNFLSVMNYRYQFSGVLSATTVGGGVPTSQRLDYSTLSLPLGGNTPGALDESNQAGTPPGDPGLGLNEVSGLAGGSSNADVFSYSDALADIPADFGPVQGPVNWSGMFGFNQTNVEADLTCGVDHPCPQLPESGLSLPRLYGHTDWAATWTSPASTQFTYAFQCLPYFGDGASLEAIGLTGPTITPSQGVQNATGCTPSPSTNCDTGSSTGGSGGWGAPIPARIDVRQGCTNNWINTSSGTSANATIHYTGGGCTICGGSTYSCFATNTSTFADPTPANSVVSAVSVTLNGVNCNGANVTVALNGTTIGTTNPGTNCSCASCQTYPTVTLIAPLGVPNWVYGGTNSLVLTSASGVTCIATATVTATYGNVSVVTYGGALLDVTKIDTTNTRFAGQLNVSNAYSDVDGDGYQDLTQQFSMAALGSHLNGSSTQATLSGVLTSGQVFTGVDRIIVTNNQPACTSCFGWDGDLQPGCWYLSPLSTSCNTVCAKHNGFNPTAGQHLGNPICKSFNPEKANGNNWVSVECCSTDNNTDWGATNATPDGTFSHPACHLACACNN